MVNFLKTLFILGLISSLICVVSYLILKSRDGGYSKYEKVLEKHFNDYSHDRTNYCAVNVEPFPILLRDSELYKYNFSPERDFPFWSHYKLMTEVFMYDALTAEFYNDNGSISKSDYDYLSEQEGSAMAVSLTCIYHNRALGGIENQNIENFRTAIIISLLITALLFIASKIYKIFQNRYSDFKNNS